MVCHQTRSGKEGVYPDLMAFTEKRLAELDPKSKLLVVEGKEKKLADLPGADRQELVNDMEVCVSLSCKTSFFVFTVCILITCDIMQLSKCLCVK